MMKGWGDVGWIARRYGGWALIIAGWAWSVIAVLIFLRPNPDYLAFLLASLSPGLLMIALGLMLLKRTSPLFLVGPGSAMVIGNAVLLLTYVVTDKDAVAYCGVFTGIGVLLVAMGIDAGSPRPGSLVTRPTLAFTAVGLVLFSFLAGRHGIRRTVEHEARRALEVGSIEDALLEHLTEERAVPLEVAIGRAREYARVAERGLALADEDDEIPDFVRNTHASGFIRTALYQHLIHDPSVAADESASRSRAASKLAAEYERVALRGLELADKYKARIWGSDP